jgi:hypothetical protein
MVLATEQDLACNVRSAAQMLPDLIGAGDRAREGGCPR